MIKKEKHERRLRIKEKIRRRISGTPDRPRLSVYRSLKHIYAQIIDDTKGTTLAATSSLSPEVRDQLAAMKGKAARSKVVGAMLARKALERNITQVVFDRGGFLYHGRVKALAEGAREAGLKF